MQRLELGLLGGFRARLYPGDVLALPTRKAQALLAYLAVPLGQVHPRDKLAALLWGDMSQKQARGNLRQVLALLRRALPNAEMLRLEGETVALDPRSVSADVARFEELAGEKGAKALADAARLYGGDLLAGLTLQEPPFEEWLIAQRERLRELAMEVVARLLAEQRRTGEVEAAIQSALKLLTLDPLQEPVHRTLMRLYGQLGRRGAALRQYQTCVAALERELRTQPEPETKALYQQILRERPAVATMMEEPPATAEVGSTMVSSRPAAAPVKRLDVAPTDIPLVGRAAELTRLIELLDGAWAGSGHTVGIFGDPGVGKSRLAAELVARAAQRGARILVGRCFETEQRLPFAVWVDALRSGGVLADAAIVNALGTVWRNELARLLPELGDGPAPDREGGDPLRLFEAICQLVERLVGRDLLVVLFEDWHWVDEMSLRLLPFMARRIQAWRMLLVGTVRDEETASSPLHRQIGETLGRERLISRLRLAPLSKEHTMALAHHLLPPGTADSALGDVWRASEGNPFMAIETARSLADGRRSEVAAGELVPRRVRELVIGRLDRLSAHGRRLVGLAAVIGRQFHFALLQRASELTEDEAAEAMEELVRRRIFHQSGDGFEFTHDRIREVAYASLLQPQRSILHRKVADGLEALYGADTPEIAGALAFHHRHAGTWAKAVHHLSRFAEQAARGYAHREAAEAVAHALNALAHTPASSSRDRQQLHLTLCHAQSLYFIGEWTESVQRLVAQASLLARVDDPSVSGPWHAWLGHIYTRLGDHQKAIASAQRAIEAADRVGDDASSGKAYGVLSLEAFWSGHGQHGVELGERAVTLLGRTDERWLLGMAHFYRAMNFISLGRFSAAHQSLGRLRAVAEAIGDNRLQSYAAWTGGWAEAQEGQAREAMASCQRALTLATDPVSHAYASAFIGYASMEAGDAAAATPRLREAIEQFARFHFPAFEAWFVTFLAEAQRLDGQLVDAAELAARGQALAGEVGFPLAIAWAQRVLGRVARARRAEAEAQKLLDNALEKFRAIEAEFETGRTLLDLTEILAAGGDVTGARAHLEAARATFARLDVPIYVTRVDELTGQLA